MRARASTATARRRSCRARARPRARRAAHRERRQRDAASAPACRCRAWAGRPSGIPATPCPRRCASPRVPRGCSAPPMPSVPPRMPSVPNVPLLTLRVRRVSTAGSEAARASQSSLWPRASSSIARPSECTEISPQKSGPSPVSNPGFKRDERRRRRRADRRRVSLSGRGIEPGRDIERENRRAARVGPQHEVRVASLGRRAKADAQEAVDHQTGARRGRLDGGRSARLDERAIRGVRVGGQALRIAGEHDVNVLEVAAQHACGDECIAAVVARSGEHHDRTSAFPGKVQRGVRGRFACAFHEVGVGIALLELAQFRNRENGGQCRCHGAIIVGGAQIASAPA